MFETPAVIHQQTHETEQPSNEISALAAPQPSEWGATTEPSVSSATFQVAFDLKVTTETTPTTDPTSAPQSNLSIESIGSSVDIQFLARVLDGTITTNDESREIALRRLVKLGGESALDVLLLCSREDVFPVNVQLAAMEETLRFFVPGSPAFEKINKHFLAIFLDTSRMGAIRHAASYPLEVGVFHQLTDLERQSLVDIASGRADSADAMPEDLAPVRARAAALLGSSGMELALNAINDSSQDKLVHLAMSETAATLAEPMHVPALVEVLSKAALQTGHEEQSSIISNVLAALHEADSEHFIRNVRRVYEESIVLPNRAIIGVCSLASALPEEFPDAFDMVFNDKTFTKKTISGILLSAAERCGEREAQLLYNDIVRAVGNEDEIIPEQLVMLTLSVLERQHPQKAADVAAKMLQHARKWIESFDGVFPTEALLTTVATYGSANEAVTEAVAIAKMRKMPAYIRNASLSFLREEAPDVADRTLRQVRRERGAKKWILTPGDEDQPSEGESATVENLLTDETPLMDSSAALQIIAQATFVDEETLDAAMTLIDEEESAIDGVSINDTLARLLEFDRSPELSILIAGALVSRGDPRGYDALIASLSDNRANKLTLQLFANMDSPEAHHIFFAALNSSDVVVSSAARLALRELAGSEEERILFENFKTLSTDERVAPKERETIAQYLNDTRAADILSIEHSYRFDPRTLRAIIHGRLHDTAKDQKPGKEALVVFAKDDSNGAFTTMASQLLSLAENGYNIRFFECGTDTELKNILVDRGTSGKPSDLIVLGGHGMREQLALSNTGGDIDNFAKGAGTLDTDDVRQFIDAGAASALRKNGQIVLVSCSTGNGATGSSSLANGLRQIFPHAKEGGIMAPRFTAVFEGFEFNDAGECVGVRFGVEQYRADLGVTTDEIHG